MKKRRNTKKPISQTVTEQNDIRYLFKQFLSIKTSEGNAERTLKQYQESFKFFCKYLNEKNRSFAIETLYNKYSH